MGIRLRTTLPIIAPEQLKPSVPKEKVVREKERKSKKRNKRNFNSRHKERERSTAMHYNQETRLGFLRTNRMEQLLNSLIQDLTLCKSKMELYVGIDMISLSCQILNNWIVLRNETLKENAKSRCKAI